MFLLAFRNVFRNKRRSFITLTSVIFASFLVLITRFLASGSHYDLLKNAVSLNSGYLQVAAFGWLESPSIERALDVDRKLIYSLDQSGIETISPRIEGGALVSHKSSSSFVSVLAANYKKEKNITNLHTYSIEGSFLHDVKTKAKKNKRNINVYPANIGYILANRLEVKNGDTIALVSSQFDGTVGAILAEVVGIYKTHNVEFDSAKVLLPLSGGETFFGLGKVPDNPRIKRYTSLALGISNELEVPQIYQKLSSLYPVPELAEGENPENSDNYSAVIHLWKELIPGLVQMLEFDVIQNEITLFFLILVMSFGILNMVQMSIQQRTKELGVMIALGTKQLSLIAMVFWEVLLILITGLLIGSIAGIWLGTYYYNNPILLSPELAEGYASLGVQMAQIRTIVTFEQLGMGLLTLSMPSLLFTLIASLRIYKINPTQILAAY